MFRTPRFAFRIVMIRYRAAWVVPICGPPINNAGVIVEKGRVVAVEATVNETPLVKMPARPV